MRKSIKAMALALPLLVILPGSGMAREFADIYTECGLGAMIAPHTEVVAAITNITWDLGTTAISTNISCPESCMGGKEKTAAFIYDSQDILIDELASGSGEYLDTLVVLSGIEAADKDGFITDLRAGVKNGMINGDMASQDRYQKAETLYNIVLHTMEG